MKVSIELDVFSGRPNPAWALEKEEAKHLNDLLQNLPVEQSPVPADGLGYRGFIVTIDDGSTIQKAHVCAGKVWADIDSSKVFTDKNGVEQLLMQMANKRGYGDILKSLGVD